MKVLLDESLPHNLLGPLSHHDVTTVDGMRWKGIKNGELLKLIEATQFDVFVTGDKNLVKQQNIVGKQLALVILSAVNRPIVKPYVSEVVEAFDTASPGTVNFINCGFFMRGPKP